MVIRSIKKLLGEHPLLVGAGAVLTLALVLGSVLRLGGTQFCLPMEHCHPDEHWLLNPALRMMRNGDLNPHFFLYPPLYVYILLGVYSLTFLNGVSAESWGDLGGIKIPPFLRAGRVTTALLGIGTLGAVHAAGRRLEDRQVGAVAALTLAVMPLHVSSSHFITTDVPAGFFCALALWAAVRVAREGGPRSYRLAGMLAGFATAAKYNAALVALNVPLAHWINPRRERFWDRHLLWGVLWVVFGFLIVNPYALLDLPAFLNGVAQEIAHYKRAHVGHQGEYNRIFYLLWLAGRGFGPVAAGLGIYGMVVMARQRRRAHLLLLVFPVLYLYFLGSYKVRFVRNLMPLLPYLSLLMALGAVQAFRDVRASWPAAARLPARASAAVGLLLMLAWPAATTFSETAAMIRTDTRLLARQWIEDNIPHGKGIYLQSWSVDSLPPHWPISRDRWRWDYYVATDRLSRKYFAMQKVVPVKYQEVVESFQHRPLKVFHGRPENRHYWTSSPTVIIFQRDPSRPRVRPW